MALLCECTHVIYGALRANFFTDYREPTIYLT